MKRSEQTRTDPGLRDRIIDVAEALFGRDGFGAVSLRQIAAEAGTKNNYAVQYHFGDVAGLARAILEKRSPQLEMQRGAMLARQGREPLTTRMVLELLNRPIIEHVDENGDRPSARLIMALHGTSWGWEPLSGAFENMPITQQLVRNLADLNPHLAPEVVWHRLSLVSVMILTCITTLPAQGISDAFVAAMVDNVLDMAAVAISAPLTDGAAEHLKILPGILSRYTAMS